MTQIELARRGKITKEMIKTAKDEQVTSEFIRKHIAEGKIVILKNKTRPAAKNFRSIGVGFGLRTKVNANIGTSPKSTSLVTEREKLKTAIKYGTDTVMDLSTGGNLRQIRKMILRESGVPVGTVPIYQAVVDIVRSKKNISQLTADEIFACIEEQLKEGVDFITVHCGVTQRVVQTLKKYKRLMGMVSRGGTFLAEWIVYNNKENPLYENFDRLLNLAYQYDAVLSLGDGLRPGCLADATDIPQVAELQVLGELAKRAWKRNVQVMIEGPGHIPLNQIRENVLLEKRICHNAPFYVLGPLVTDIAPGYDHITCAIGGALAASYGADFLCYVTPSEHLRLPTVEDVREGVMAVKIAAHAADVVKQVKGASDWDRKMSRARKKLDWKSQEMLSLDREKFRLERKKLKLRTSFGCTMCGEFCAMKEMDKFFKRIKK